MLKGLEEVLGARLKNREAVDRVISTACPAGDPCPATGCPSCCPSYDPCSLKGCRNCDPHRRNEMHVPEEAKLVDAGMGDPKPKPECVHNCETDGMAYPECLIHRDE